VTLQAILDAQGEQLKFDDLLAAIAQEENSDGCEFEELCRQELRKPGSDPPKYLWRCGWVNTSILWCGKRRRRLLGGEP